MTEFFFFFFFHLCLLERPFIQEDIHASAGDLLVHSGYSSLVQERPNSPENVSFFFRFGRILVSVSSAEFPLVSPSNHVGFIYALIALQQHSPLPRRFYPSENWLSSRCLNSVIVRELVFPSWREAADWGMPVLCHNFKLITTKKKY